MELIGEYATIDTKSSVAAITDLRSGDKILRTKTAKLVQANSDKYCPAVFFPLSVVLFESGDTETALFWLYAGRIRTQFDMKRSTDETVFSGYELLNKSVPDLLKLSQFENLEATKKIVAKVIEWDRKTAYNYDPRWIALHGLGAFQSASADRKEKSLTIPESKWPALAEANRNEYWKNFIEDMDNLTPDQISTIKEKIAALKKEKKAGDH